MAGRFWKAQPVSGAIVSIASPPQVRLTVASTTGMTTGDIRTVFGIVGTTEANGTWTITVIDGTHIDLQGTTFTNLYTSGGSINGKWDTTNANNWVSTSNGTDYGQTVPGSGDTVTFDGSSGGGTVTVNTTVTATSITCGAHTGTLDFSANNNNVNLTSFNGSGTGTRTLNLGNGTWTISGTSGTPWTISTTTNLTFNANSSVILITGTATAARTVTPGALTYNTFTIGPSSSSFVTSLTSATTYANLNLVGPLNIGFTNAVTSTSTAINWSGSSGSEIFAANNTINGTTAVVSVASGSPTMTWLALRDMVFSGGATFNATNSFDLQHNSGVTITPPASGAAGLSRARAFAGMA